MKLIAALPSPFVRKVRVLLHETGQTDAVELVEISTTPMNTDAQAAAANPVGKIPALVLEDGPAIYDSRVICRYLDDRFGAGLYPESRLSGFARNDHRVLFFTLIHLSEAPLCQTSHWTLP